MVQNTFSREEKSEIIFEMAKTFVGSSVILEELGKDNSQGIMAM